MNDDVINGVGVMPDSGAVIITPASIETISNIDSYKRDFTILTDGFYNSNSYGHLIYTRPEEPIANLINYSSDFSEVLWEREETESGMNKITASTEVTTNQGNHFVLYFRNSSYKIINRITGSTVLENNLPYPIIDILRKSIEELLFISNIHMNLFNVYTLDEVIQVGTEENDIEICNQRLLNNYPNPFNPTTTINFSLQSNTEVELTVYNIKGQKIKTLIKNEFIKGTHSIIWNGDDESGKNVSSGVYFYKLNVNGKTEAMKKCLLLK